MNRGVTSWSVPGVELVTSGLLVAGTVLVTAFAVRHPDGLPPHVLVPLFYNIPLTLAFAVVGVAILRRLPTHPVGWLFAAVGLAVGYGFFAEGYAAWRLPGLTWVLWAWTLTVCLIFFGLARALSLFPSGRPASRRWRWLDRLLWGYLAAAVLVTAAAPWPRSDDFIVVQVMEHRREWPAHNPLQSGAFPWLTDAATLVAPLGALLLLATLPSLLTRWRQARGDERHQIKWLALAGLLAGVVICLGVVQTLVADLPDDDPVGDLVGDAVFTLIIAGIPLAVGLGVIRYRLYDIDRILSRAIVYGTLTVLIGAVYVLGVMVVGDAVGRRPAGSPVLGLVTTAGLAVAFAPVRSRLQLRADRWVYGARAAPYKVMVRLGHDLGQVVDAASVVDCIADAVIEAVPAQSARVAVTLPQGSTMAATRGRAGPGDPMGTVVTIHDGEEAIGEIAVAADGLRRADVALLDHIAGVSTAALRNLRLLDELESLYEIIRRRNRDLVTSRARLASAAEDERRRLGTMIAERVEPDLRRLSEGVARLRAEAGTDPERAIGSCEDLTVAATRLVGSIRETSHGILPPLLNDHGFLAAIRATLRRIDAEVTLDVAPDLHGRRYPPQIETTAYLACHAVVAAATRRGGATTVRIWIEGDLLCFTVSHDGDGPGIGDDAEVETARERLSAVGGGLLIRRRRGSIEITASIPIDSGAPDPTSVADDAV